jgi:hypothetical protein
MWKESSMVGVAPLPRSRIVLSISENSDPSLVRSENLLAHFWHTGECPISGMVTRHLLWVMVDSGGDRIREKADNAN